MTVERQNLSSLCRRALQVRRLSAEEAQGPINYLGFFDGKKLVEMICEVDIFDCHGNSFHGDIEWGR